MSINFSYFYGLKGEFEAEGLSLIELTGEVIYGLRSGLDYLVKISGSEATSEITYLQRIGVKRIVCPMVESGFSARKYMNTVDGRSFEHLGITIETKTAVENIDEILEQGFLLTDITIGRSDLSGSLEIKDVESAIITDIVKNVAHKAKDRGLRVGMGGSVSKKTQQLLLTDGALYNCLDFVETRKAVMTKENFMKNGALESAIELELELLQMRKKSLSKTLGHVQDRITKIQTRI